MNLSISEKLCYSTIRIESKNSKGELFTGTGFIFKLEIYKDNYFNFIITNKHVIHEMSEISFIMTKANENFEPLNSEHFSLGISLNPLIIANHPDETVDLCAIDLSILIGYAIDKGNNPYYNSIEEKMLPTKQILEDLPALEEVLMIGYPNGIWDSVNNMPILRRGSTATHPNLDYEGKKEFLVDIACFPGSSGSPVFLYNPMQYSSRDGSVWLMERVLLLGILYAGTYHTAEGEVKVINIPSIKKAISLSVIPNNLGLVIKAERILELKEVLRGNEFYKKLIDSGEN